MITPSLYLAFIKIRLNSVLQYRLAYALSAISQTISYGVTFALIWVMIYRFQSLNGWGPYEVMLLYAMNLCSYAMAAVFLHGGCQILASLIRTGEFDEILTKPVNPLFYLAARHFFPGYATHLTLSITIMVICFSRLGISFPPVKVLLLLVSLLGAAMIQGSAIIITTVPAFWLIQNSSVRAVFFNGLKRFVDYPLSLYHKSVQILLTLVFPYAFISFYPSQFFIGKGDFLMFHPSFQYLTPLVGVLSCFLAYAFWKFGINHYRSTGS